MASPEDVASPKQENKTKCHADVAAVAAEGNPRLVVVCGIRGLMFGLDICHNYPGEHKQEQISELFGSGN